MKEKNILSHRLYFMIMMPLCISTGLLFSMQRGVRVVGIDSNFNSIPDKNRRPEVRVVQAGGKSANIPLNDSWGGLQTLNEVFPVKIRLRYERSGGSSIDYFIEIDQATGGAQKACFGASPVTIVARMSSDSGVLHQESKICLSRSATSAPQSVIRSGDFNGVALLLRPNPDNQDPDDTSRLPFKFGLSAWTSNVAPWTSRTLNRFADDYHQYVFGKRLTIFQGFGGLGGGQAPRLNHAAIGHIFNDTDEVVLIARRSSHKDLAKYNYSQMIPPRSVLPYATFWIPRVRNKNELNTQGHDGIRVGLLRTRPKTPTSSDIYYTPISELGAATELDFLPGELELMDLFEDSKSQADMDASDILGVNQWADNQVDYPALSVANHFYMITTDAQERKTYVQKCFIETDECELTEQSPIGGSAETAYTTSGLPSYYNLVIKKDSQDEFVVEMYKAKLAEPYAY